MGEFIYWKGASNCMEGTLPKTNSSPLNIGLPKVGKSMKVVSHHFSGPMLVLGSVRFHTFHKISLGDEQSCCGLWDRSKIAAPEIPRKIGFNGFVFPVNTIYM